MGRRKRVATSTGTGKGTRNSNNKKRSPTIIGTSGTATLASSFATESISISFPVLPLQNEASSNKKTKTKSSSMKKSTTSSPMNDKTNNNDDDDEEIRICNERIRHANAVEFLQQQQQRMEQIYSKKDNINTNIPISMTRNMLYILQQMQHTCCTCTICHCIYNQPITLSNCAHTFCKSCIHAHCDNSWYCPIPSCKLPISMKQQDRKFWNVNSVTQTVVTSWSNICHTLMEADDRWWMLYSNNNDDELTKMIQALQSEMNQSSTVLNMNHEHTDPKVNDKIVNNKENTTSRSVNNCQGTNPDVSMMKKRSESLMKDDEDYFDANTTVNDDNENDIDTNQDNNNNDADSISLF